VQTTALMLLILLLQKIRTMKIKIIQLLTVFLFGLHISSTYAMDNSNNTLKVASIFSNHMVLQRDLPVLVWGKAKAGTKVTVDFSNQTQTATTNSSGDWKLQLKPLKGSFSPKQMTISSDNNQIITFVDILVGEVWVCSGQSNMAFTIDAIKGINVLKDSAKKIRSFSVKRTVSLTEQTTMEGTWEPSIPNSAVAFSFAYYLQEHANVPIGIILTAWGSSSIEAWMPRDLTTKLPYFKTIMQEFDKDISRIERINNILSGPKPWPIKDDIYLRRQPNVLFNAMMKPIAPYTIKGIIWYQGERNTLSMHGSIEKPWFKNTSGMLNYKEALQVWIKRYRQEWNNDQMNFMIVMLPRFTSTLSTSPTKDNDHPSAHSWAWMRESQLSTSSLPNVSVVNTIDLGDPDNIHPLDKLPIGQRLAKLAARDTLHKNIEAQGPIFKKAEIFDLNITLHFEHDDGLITNNGKAPAEFWLANNNQQWAKAEAKIVNNKIILTSDQIKRPLYVRYAFTGAPEVNLVNRYGLPTQPFRTDNFKP